MTSIELSPVSQQRPLLGIGHGFSSRMSWLYPSEQSNRTDQPRQSGQKVDHDLEMRGNQLGRYGFLRSGAQYWLQ